MRSRLSIVKLGEVLTQRKEKPDLDKILDGEIPIIAKIEFDTGKIELRKQSETKTDMILIKPGDLVISGINVAKGAIAVYGEENIKPAAATIHYSSYEIDRQKADSAYLWYFFRSEVFKKILIRSLSKGIKTEVKPKRFLPIQIPLPPLEEQKRIVARIEEVVSRMEQVKNIQEEALVDTVAIMRSALRQTFSKIEDKKWKWERLSDVSIDIRAGFACGFKSKTEGFPHLRMNNIDINGQIDLSLLWRAPVGRSEIEKYLLKKGDVLFNNTNSVELVGKTALFDIEKGDYVFSNHLTRLRPDHSKLLSEWLVAYLRYLWQTRYFQNNCTRWINQAAFNRDKLVRLKIPLPTVEEQKEIITKLAKIQESATQLELYLQTTKEKIEAMKQSVFNMIFSEAIAEAS